MCDDKTSMFVSPSYAAHTKTQLDEYFRTISKVRVLRAPERQGLIRARLLGAKNTTAQIITFLDAHVECTVGITLLLSDNGGFGVRFNANLTELSSASFGQIRFGFG